MRIAILGCGPVGLLTAHAAHRYLEQPEVSIYSIMEKSRFGGAQYLHSAVPGLTGDKPDAKINYDKLGTRDGYAEKVYGDPLAECSWELFSGTLPAWDLQKHYEELWGMYSPLIYDTEVRADLIHRLLDDNDLVFSSINPQGYCENPEEHQFLYQEVYLVTDPDIREPSEGTIVYNGLEDDEWYRASNLFGDFQAEYPGNWEPDKKRDLRKARKPLMTTCECFVSEQFLRTGRYGVFEKEWLVDDAFRYACEVFEDEV